MWIVPNILLDRIFRYYVFNVFQIIVLQKCLFVCLFCSDKGVHNNVIRDVVEVSAFVTCARVYFCVQVHLKRTLNIRCMWKRYSKLFSAPLNSRSPHTHVTVSSSARMISHLINNFNLKSLVIKMDSVSHQWRLLWLVQVISWQKACCDVVSNIRDEAIVFICLSHKC